MRLPPQAHELIDRSREVVFSFDGTPVPTFAGDTIGPALFASGRRVFSRGLVMGVTTNRGSIACDTVVSATAGWSTLVCHLAGVPLPITTHILQAFITEPVKPFLDVVIVSATQSISSGSDAEYVVPAGNRPNRSPIEPCTCEWTART